MTNDVLSWVGEPGIEWRVEADTSSEELVRALREAAQDDPESMRSGQLRSRLESRLGSRASAYRREIHQLTAAVDENLPANLLRIQPLTTPALARLSGELAAARGWGPETARQVTTWWASALGFAEVAQGEWPQEPVQAAASPPPPPAQDGLSDAPAVRPVEWPSVPERFIKRHAVGVRGDRVLGVSAASAGIDSTLYLGLVGVFLVAGIGAIIVLPATWAWVPSFLVLVFGRLALTASGPGALVATREGLEFSPYDWRGQPRTEGVFTAPWSEVTAAPGRRATFLMAGRRVQVRYESAFVRAVKAQLEVSS